MIHLPATNAGAIGMTGVTTPGAPNIVKMNAFTANLEQKVRYMVSKQQKYKATDTLNQKRPNPDTCAKVSTLTGGRGTGFTANRTGGASIWDGIATPKQTATTAIRGPNYDLITQAKREVRRAENSLAKWAQFRR